MKQTVLLTSFDREKTEPQRQYPQLVTELGFEPGLEGPCLTTLLWNCFLWLPTSCLLPSPFIQNPIHMYKLIQRAAAAATNSWIRSIGSNCNLRTILWRYLRTILWNPTQMGFTPKDSDSSSSWSGKTTFTEESSLCFEKPYTCLPESKIPT